DVCECLRSVHQVGPNSEPEPLRKVRAEAPAVITRIVGGRVRSTAVRTSSTASTGIRTGSEPRASMTVLMARRVLRLPRAAGTGPRRCATALSLRARGGRLSGVADLRWKGVSAFQADLYAEGRRPRVGRPEESGGGWGNRGNSRRRRATSRRGPA